MRNDFTFYNPTKIYFGRHAIDNLAEELRHYGKRVMLAYGKSAIKKMGLYDTVVEILTQAGKEIVDMPGIKPNPTYAQVLEGARLVRENDVDLILAVGGGSVIDCAKAISVAAYCDGDPWEKYWEKFEPVANRVVPVGSEAPLIVKNPSPLRMRTRTVRFGSRQIYPCAISYCAIASPLNEVLPSTTRNFLSISQFMATRPRRATASAKT